MAEADDPSAVAASTISPFRSPVSRPRFSRPDRARSRRGRGGCEIPYACRSGECGVSVTRLVSGEGHRWRSKRRLGSSRQGQGLYTGLPSQEHGPASLVVEA
ncbi:hypothetical protein ACRAWD_20555 [Caulobacter segnis]